MQVVHVVARKIEKLSTRLVECADIVAEAVEGEEELDQTVQENTEILRRDWSSQVRKVLWWARFIDFHPFSQSGDLSV